MNQLDMYNTHILYSVNPRFCAMPVLPLYLRDQRIDVVLQVLGRDINGGFDYRVIHGNYLRSDIQSQMSAMELADAAFLICTEVEMAGVVNLVSEELDDAATRSVKNVRLK